MIITGFCYLSCCFFTNSRNYRNILSDTIDDDDIDIENIDDIDDNIDDDNNNQQQPKLDSSIKRLQQQQQQQKQQRRNLNKNDYNDDAYDDDDYYYDDNIDGVADKYNDKQQQNKYFDDLTDDVYGDAIDDNVDDDDNNVFMLDMYRSIVPHFDILNLVPIDTIDNGEISTNINGRPTINHPTLSSTTTKNRWNIVGNITFDRANINTIIYIGSEQTKLPNYIVYAENMNQQQRQQKQQPSQQQQQNIIVDNHDDSVGGNNGGVNGGKGGGGGGGGKPRFRVVTNIAPPFVIESTKLDNNTCLIGDFCLKVSQKFFSHHHSFFCLHFPY